MQPPAPPYPYAVPDREGARPHPEADGAPGGLPGQAPAWVPGQGPGREVDGLPGECAPGVGESDVRSLDAARVGPGHPQTVSGITGIPGQGVPSPEHAYGDPDDAFGSGAAPHADDAATDGGGSASAEAADPATAGPPGIPVQRPGNRPADRRRGRTVPGPRRPATPAAADTAPDAAATADPAAAATADTHAEAHAEAQAHAAARRLARRVVKAVGFCAAVTAGTMLLLRGNEALTGLATAPAAPSAAKAPAIPAAAPDPGRVVQIVAHPDDDLYFMNPELRHSLSAGTGHSVTSVYLTSGEADGVNAGAAGRASARPDKRAYAEARQNGIRAAYAKMATGDRTSAWKRTSVPTRGGGRAEVDVLVARPEVHLVWLQLREAGTVHAEVPDSLRGLWDGKAARLESVLASGSPVTEPYAYSRDDLVRTLVGILDHYRPTTVRAQDPTPGRTPGTGRFTDHQDHFYGARFAQAALAAYAAQVKDRPHFAVQNYLGYSNGSLPGTLDPQTSADKLDIMDVYAWVDRENHCGSSAGCGDLKVADHPAGNNWTSNINHARGSGTSWLTSDRRHGLWAFQVLDGQVALWHRAGPIGPWSGPHLLPGTGMDPGVSTVTLPDGRIAAFATRTTLGEQPADYRREVVYAVQSAPGAKEFGPWQSLGTPEASDADRTSDISAPAVSADGTGRLAAYVRDGGHTLRGREQRADGTWGPWEAHGGAGLLGTPVAATDAAGRRMVFAATAASVTAWAQPAPGAPLGPATPTGLPQTALPLTADAREGGVRLWLRKPGSGDVRTALATTAPDGTPAVRGLTDLGGLQGFGAVAAGGHVLAARAAGGQLGAELGEGRPWERSPLLFVGDPSAAVTANGATVNLAVMGLDARLYTTSSPDTPKAYLTPWQPLGPSNTGRPRP
ncbi:PIG-L family deacetylase [Streptomyces toxytricini]|uniref:PIG-L family deacetylase n=1 Tax=Streptomyces toxytricini TaxID=67369 RepID=A0ABW8EB12_STRT5